jgi:predicted DNA-binding protein (MmcQ/YjbR family)
VQQIDWYCSASNAFSTNITDKSSRHLDGGKIQLQKLFQRIIGCHSLRHVTVLYSYQHQIDIRLDIKCSLYDIHFLDKITPKEERINIKFSDLQRYCLDKKAVTGGYPFGPGTLVFKVMGKMFALMHEDSSPLSMNLKCSPDDALALRAQYRAIQPGYHMNKRHWNTVVIDGSLPEDIVFELIDHSYDLVAKGLNRADREKIFQED